MPKLQTDMKFDPDESTLLRLISDSLSQSDKPLDIESLKSEFSLIDKSTENTLTARQVRTLTHFRNQ
jgi:hypothetical protein